MQTVTPDWTREIYYMLTCHIPLSYVDIRPTMTQMNPCRCNVPLIEAKPHVASLALLSGMTQVIVAYLVGHIFPVHAKPHSRTIAFPQTEPLPNCCFTQILMQFGH